MNHFKEIAARLSDFGIDAMMLTHQANRFYASGLDSTGTDGLCVVTRNKTYYLTDSRYIEHAQEVVTGAVVECISIKKGYEDFLKEIIASCGITKLGYEENFLTVALFERYKKALPCELVASEKLVTELRQTKSAEEIECIVAAQRIAERALDEICGFIQPGMTEKEIAAKLIYDMLRFGADKLSFEPIVVAGPNGSLPHGVPGLRKVQKGDFITMDFGCMIGGYCSDMTRTVALGEPSDEMRKVYQTVLDAQLAGIALMKAGVKGAEVHQAGADIIEQAGYGAYFGHGFGHSVGVEIHEGPNASPKGTAPLPAGAVVTAEPGIYLPGKFGVRIEDMVHITEQGPDNLTLAKKELLIL